MDDPRNSPYYKEPENGDALAEHGLSDITHGGTFPYPEAVNMRRTPSLSGLQISRIPFRLSTSTVHQSLPEARRIGG